MKKKNNSDNHIYISHITSLNKDKVRDMLTILNGNIFSLKLYLDKLLLFLKTKKNDEKKENDNSKTEIKFIKDDIKSLINDTSYAYDKIINELDKE